MLKVEMNKEENKIEVCGNVVDITTDVSFLISTIYRELTGEAKEFFGENITEFMVDGIYKMNHEQLDALNAENKKKMQEKKKEDAKKDLKDGLKELAKELKGLFKELGIEDGNENKGLDE